jgi:hypothetical protein
MANRIDDELSELQGVVSSIRSKARILDDRLNDGNLVVSSMPEHLRQEMLDDLVTISGLIYRAEVVLLPKVHSEI